MNQIVQFIKRNFIAKCVKWGQLGRFVDSFFVDKKLTACFHRRQSADMMNDAARQRNVSITFSRHQYFDGCRLICIYWRCRCCLSGRRGEAAAKSLSLIISFRR